jgi:hypothetical protein
LVPVVVLFAASAVRPALGNPTIVTTTRQGVTDPNCSQQEAIHSANFHQPLAIEDDAHNPFGPTATPIVFSKIIIEANGATLVAAPGAPNMRAFAVGAASIATHNGVLSGTGKLTIRNAYIKGFEVKGGDGTSGGGGGLGAGGEIYLDGSMGSGITALTIENCTFRHVRSAGRRTSLMTTLHRYMLPGNQSVLIELEDGPAGGGGPVAIADRLKETGKTLTDALSALPPLLLEVKNNVLDKLSSPSEVKVEFGAKISGEVGLIVSSSQAEANFKISIVWKKP